MRWGSVWLLVWCCCAAAACGSTREQENAEGAMNVIEDTVLAETLESEGVVCVVVVKTADVSLAGTRSARFTATVDVTRSLHGRCGDSLQLAGHARDDSSPLEPGASYVVAATPSARVAPAWWLEGQAEIPAGDAQATVDAHLALIQRLGGA